MIRKVYSRRAAVWRAPETGAWVSEKGHRYTEFKVAAVAVSPPAREDTSLHRTWAAAMADALAYVQSGGYSVWDDGHPDVIPFDEDTSLAEHLEALHQRVNPKLPPLPAEAADGFAKLDQTQRLVAPGLLAALQQAWDRS